MDERPVMAYIAHETGIVFEQLGNDGPALTRYQEALRLACEASDLSIAGFMITSLGRLYEHAGDYPMAIACHTASAHIALKTGDRLALGPGLAALARTSVAQGRHTEAVTLHERALALLLPQPYERCEHVQRYAELLFRLERYEEACSRNQEAQRLLGNVGRKDIELAAQLLTMRLDLALGTITSREVVGKLHAMLPLWPGRAEQAAIYFAIWQLDRIGEGSRRRAAEAYRQLYERMPRSAFHRRYRLLTGQALPPPPPLPQPPAIVMQYALDSDELLARIDQLRTPALS
jgi:tetratricopeptide (TPR) repeat protein